MTSHHRKPIINVYFDVHDWWVGYYMGVNAHFVCLLPTVVIRIRRKHARSIPPITGRHT